MVINKEYTHQTATLPAIDHHTRASKRFKLVYSTYFASYQLLTSTEMQGADAVSLCLCNTTGQLESLHCTSIVIRVFDVSCFVFAVIVVVCVMLVLLLFVL